MSQTNKNIKAVKISIEYNWEITVGEWKELKEFEESHIIEKLKSRFEWDPVSAFFNLRQIKVPDVGKVKVEVLDKENQ